MNSAKLPADIPRSRHAETILILKYELSVRRLAEIVLSSLGYQLELAEDGNQGLERFVSFRFHSNGFHRCSDARTSGPELVNRIRQENPEVKVLFASGFTQTSQDGALDDFPSEASMPLLPKPYTASVLGKQVGKILYGESEAS